MNENKKLCVVVPYRDRESHLSQFIPHMTQTMSEQSNDYTILIVEQEKGKPFNRAKLLNIGFDYTKGKYDYYVFHDIDMLPVESDYGYCGNPTHLAAKTEQFGWKLPYEQYFGGVTLFDKESFIKINGYSNEYWGWGAEDDDVFNRCRQQGLKVSRKQCSFRSLSHDRNIVQSEYNRNLEILRESMNRIDKDGLNSLEYLVLEEIDHGTYTQIKVNI